VIKALITDFGGVLVRTHTDRSRRELERKLNLPLHTIEERVFNCDLSIRAQHGEMTEDEFWSAVVKELQADDQFKDAADFRHEFFADDFLDNELVNLIRSVRPAIKTGLISNAWTDLRKVLRNTFAIEELFDVLVISAEEKIMKPDPWIYRLALNRLGVKAHESIFLDDVHLNVDAARATGMIGVHFHSTEQAQREIRALLAGDSLGR
jgi:putative hydrolase of the HAD superfamily